MTIYIKRNELNQCIFTLNESANLPDSSFILQIQSKVDKKSKIMWLFGDVSFNVNRYNEYIIEEVILSEEDLEEKKVNLPEPSYSFYVWETISDILDLQYADKVIESGKIIVKN